jgi:hypothetical protein
MKIDASTSVGVNASDQTVAAESSQLGGVVDTNLRRSTTEVPFSALADFDAEIEADRNAGRLQKIGDSSDEATSYLSRL